MAVWSEISTSRLVGAIRLDAEFWQPKFLAKEEQIRVGNHTHLGALVSTFKKGIFYILAREYADQGIPFYRSSNVGAILPNEDNVAFITTKKHSGEHKTALITGDLMIVKTGKSGASVVFDETCNVSQDVIAVKAIRDRVNPYYLAVFLNTKYGKSEMDRWFQGQVQPHLSLEDARKIWVSLIPDNAQSEVENLVIASATARDDANRAYTQAQQLLESELGLDKLRFDKPVSYTARFSELELSRRADAEFFNPELRYFQQEIAKHHPLRPITDIVSILKFSNPPYSDTGLPIITQKHLGKISPDNYGDDLVAQDAWVQANPLALIKGFDLLYYSVGAYLGKTNIWLSDDKAVHASFITMLRCFDPEESGFLHVLLNSKYGILQSKCFQSGTSQPYIYPKDIRRFLMPAVSKSLRRQIHELVIESYRKGEESKQLLDQAKSRVEQLIKEAVQS